MPENKEFIVKRIHVWEFVSIKSNGYLNVSPYLRKYNKTINQWIDSDVYRNSFVNQEKKNIEEVKYSDEKNNGYYINPGFLIPFLEWLSNDYERDIAEYQLNISQIMISTIIHKSNENETNKDLFDFCEYILKNGNDISKNLKDNRNN